MILRNFDYFRIGGHRTQGRLWIGSAVILVGQMALIVGCYTARYFRMTPFGSDVVTFWGPTAVAFLVQVLLFRRVLVRGWPAFLLGGAMSIAGLLCALTIGANLFGT